MTPAQHYREAERLVEAFQSSIDDLLTDQSDIRLQQQIEQGRTLCDLMLSTAHTHATLALVGATFIGARGGMNSAAANELHDAITDNAR